MHGGLVLASIGGRRRRGLHEEPNRGLRRIGLPALRMQAVEPRRSAGIAQLVELEESRDEWHGLFKKSIELHLSVTFVNGEQDAAAGSNNSTELPEDRAKLVAPDVNH